MFKSIVLAFAVFLVGQIFASPVEATNCGYSKCWGAVGFGPGGARAYAHSYSSERKAINSVKRNCEYDCTVIKTFYNTCGAIAAGHRNGWGWGWAPTRAAAERTALRYCRQNTYNCSIRAWSCSR